MSSYYFLLISKPHLHLFPQSLSERKKISVFARNNSAKECGWQSPKAQAWASISRHCSHQVPKHSQGLSWGEFFQIKKWPGWLPVIQAGSQPQTCFYLSCLSLIISCQETDNRDKEAFWLSQVLGSPKGFRGLQTTRLRQSQQVPLGFPAGCPFRVKAAGSSGVPGQYSISSGPYSRSGSLCVYHLSLLQTHCFRKPRTSSVHGRRGSKRLFRKLLLYSPPPTPCPLET